MFEQFFGFKNTPFSKSILPSDMFIFASFKELHNRFDYIKNYRGIMILTGESGTGKTSAVRFFIHSLPSQSFFPIYLPLSTVGVVDFYRQLNIALKGEYKFFKSDAFDSIQKQILDYTLNKNIIPVIIFDEAHLLKEQNIKELQIIANFKYDTVDPAIFILVGQNVLQDRLLSVNLNSFYQRISLKYTLCGLTREETKLYILHQFKINNCEEEILTEPAFESVHKLSHGCIRIIGSIVNKALILAFLERRRKITEEDIIKVSQEVL